MQTVNITGVSLVSHLTNFLIEAKTRDSSLACYYVIRVITQPQKEEGVLRVFCRHR